jgi:type II secretory pathway component GspD/PulD (secretin)/tetratricopeptide (TPR) repeat protein
MRSRSLLVPGLLVTALVGCRSSESRPEPSADSASDSAAPEGAEAEAARQQQQQQAQQLGQTGERIERLREQAEYLSQQYIAQGDALLDQADLEGALREYSQALEVDPTNDTARTRLRRVQSMMGEDFAGAAQGIQDAMERETVRRAQARLEAEQLSIDGDNALRAEEYDTAIERYRRALNILRYNPLIADATLDERVLQNKLDSAVRLADEYDAATSQQREREAEAARMAREEEQRTYRETKLRQLYAEANSAFQREQYGTAQTLAEQILLYDPGNEAALQMREIAGDARHLAVNEINRREFRENWVRTFEELGALAVPQTDTVQFDLSRWREVQTRRPYEFRGGDQLDSADKQAVLRVLEETRVPARFGADGEGAPLEEVAAYLQNVTGVNFVLSAAVRDELDETEKSIQLDLPERSVRQLLDIITEVRENLRYKIEDGVVKFVTREELTGGQALRMYEVRDLIRPVRDFPGREINIQPSGGVPESDEEIEEREFLVITEDALDTLIRDNVSPDSWDADPANSLRISNGTMVVNQTPEVHAKIQKLLDDLREATGIMVDIQARFLTVEDNFLEDIGVDFRGLGSPGKGTNAFFNDFGDTTAQQTLGQELGTDTELGAFLDEGDDGDIRGRTENLFDRFLGDEDVLTGSGGLQVQWTYLNDLQLEMILTAVSKSERVELVTAPRILVFNTARSNLAVMNQVAYVQDFDVEIAQAASIADPIISVVEDGVILDVRPVVSADRRFVTLEVRPTVAELQRPIRTFVTSLGASGNSVTIQLPEVEKSMIKTSIPMPDGGTVMLGGMKVHENQDLRSGVPILNKIPLISFLFERQGTYVSNRKLLILLKARIVIPQESEPTPAQMGLDKSLSLGR